jgi:hypothetical protein
LALLDELNLLGLADIANTIDRALVRTYMGDILNDPHALSVPFVDELVKATGNSHAYSELLRLISNARSRRSS